jgi:hypothetical protein
MQVSIILAPRHVFDVVAKVNDVSFQQLDESARPPILGKMKWRQRRSSIATSE